MSPPFPPSPPEGPPRGTNFSLRNAMQPFPPAPAFTTIFASSTNTRRPQQNVIACSLRGYDTAAGKHKAAKILPMLEIDRREHAKIAEKMPPENSLLTAPPGRPPLLLLAGR